MTTGTIRDRFPGLGDGSARFDGPAGTLMVDSAIHAMQTYMSSAGTANVGGAFSASQETQAVVDRARQTVAELLGATDHGIVFGANMTTLTFAFTRAVAREFEPGDEIVCTELDHDANVTPWVLAAADRGAQVVVARLEPETGRLPVDAVRACFSERTKWVAVTGASNLIGTIPDVGAIVEAAHSVGARAYVDAVHLAPHRRVDVRSLGCDALVTSPYKWYGPHAGVLVLQPDLLASLEPYKVRPASDLGPRRLETGTPAFESIAGVEAAARFLLGQGMTETATHELEVFGPLLSGLQSIDGVTVYGPPDLESRAPTVLFNVARIDANAVASALAQAGVAVWSGNSYAVEGARALGLDSPGVAVRAGVVRYTSAGDVERLLTAVSRLAGDSRL